ncbi:MAG: hypothetical protein K2M73_06140 [Lachnospiraceae bacterium]|nr:hypothetical protein [Lachnospiraceae bacterium]
MGLGLKRGTVVLEPHSEQWDSNSGETIYLLESILGYDAICNLESKGMDKLYKFS